MLDMDQRRRKPNMSTSEEVWTCAICIKDFSLNERVMECDKCKKHFCTKCIKMPAAAYDYLSQSTNLWFCVPCTTEVRESLDDPEKHETPSRKNDEGLSEIRKDLDSTITSVKTLMNDFYCFMNAPKISRPPEEQELGTIANWNITQTKVKPIKEIILEAGEEQRREEEEKARRKKNIIVHKAPEDFAKSNVDRATDDKELVDKLLHQINVPPLSLAKCTRIGKPLGPSEGKSRPLLLTFDDPGIAELAMKNLNKLKDAPTELKLLRITPDRSMKEREEVRNLILQAKNLTSKEKGEYVHLVRGNQIIRVKSRNTQKLNSGL